MKEVISLCVGLSMAALLTTHASQKDYGWLATCGFIILSFLVAFGIYRVLDIRTIDVSLKEGSIKLEAQRAELNQTIEAGEKLQNTLETLFGKLNEISAKVSEQQKQLSLSLRDSLALAGDRKSFEEVLKSLTVLQGDERIRTERLVNEIQNKFDGVIHVERLLALERNGAELQLSEGEWKTVDWKLVLPLWPSQTPEQRCSSLDTLAKIANKDCIP